MNSFIKCWFLEFFLVLCVAYLSACDKPRLNSVWLDREISINGDDHEWQQANRYYDEDTRVTIRVFNDEDFLYLSMASKDRGI